MLKSNFYPISFFLLGTLFLTSHSALSKPLETPSEKAVAQPFNMDNIVDKTQSPLGCLDDYLTGRKIPLTQQEKQVVALARQSRALKNFLEKQATGQDIHTLRKPTDDDEPNGSDDLGDENP